ncbi:MAG TPA: hypothetical protein VMB50_01630 [Myxococcales bacterium]|nr:hypothetical protein [Myxococcales bacterium]
MRHLTALGILAALAGCSLQAVGDRDGGTTGSAGDSGSTIGGSAGSGTTGTGSSGQASGSGGSNGGSGGACGPDDCPACSIPYSCQDDHCVGSSWQCGCGCLDSGVNPPCGNVICPVGCNVSPDCTTCVPQGPNAGLGTACQTNDDCCTGTCINGACSPEGIDAGGACHTAGQDCATVADCCTGFECVAGSCTFIGGGPCGLPSQSCNTTSDCCLPFKCLGGICLSATQTDGGGCTSNTLTFIGDWSGVYSSTETITTGVVGGTGGPDRESVVAGLAPGEIVFADFLPSVFPSCSVTATIQSSTVADLATGSTCTDQGGAVWTFTSGEVLLNSPCSMSVLAAGTSTGNGQAGTFAITLALSL